MNLFKIIIIKKVFAALLCELGKFSSGVEEKIMTNEE